MVDTNIIVDVLQPDPAHGRASARRLRKALQSYALLVPPFVYCELMAAGRSAGLLADFFVRARLGLERDIPLEVYDVAAQRYQQYLSVRRQGDDVVQCPGCGATQHPTCSKCARSLSSRKMPFDFLIGAFAVVAGDRHTLTRDPGTYQRYFPDLILV